MSAEPAAARWLLLAHAFNMDGVASSQTVTDKLPYLAQAGVRIVAVTAPTGRHDAQLEHHQVFSPLPSGLRYEWRHWLKRNAGGRARIYSRIALALLLPFYLLEKILLPFGSHWSWWISAYRRGARIIERERPALIYSSGGANSAHYAAYRLAQRYQLPWLAEVHDPMIHDGWQKGPFQHWWAAHVEKLICRRADAAIWFTPTALARARARNPQLGGRGHLMYPGANPPPHAKIPYLRGEKFVLAHFGSLADNRNLVRVLEAMAQMLQAHPQWREKFLLRAYGGGWDRNTRA
ncbi:MAG TPA: glycosyltransferase, partial [Nevskiaceae bacterium]|nr:glycosyltransferase [Nevskiaceae bacterium]